MLQIAELRKSFRDPDGQTLPILDVPSFQAQAAEQIALIGSSGSGKTTLLHVLAGILPADGGMIVYTLPAKAGGAGLEGRTTSTDLARLTESGRDQFRGAHIGYIFQTHHLLPAFTALENVLLGMTFSGRQADRAWALHLLERVGLQDRLKYRPAKLSVGQQQRVAVARALANRCALLLADEPTGALDARNAQDVITLIQALSGEIGATVLVVTHDLEIAGRFGRQVNLRDINLVAADAGQKGAA